MSESKRLRVLTWQVHGNYQYYLAQVPVDWYLVTRPGFPPGYVGRSSGFAWPANVHEVAQSDLASARCDCVLYQSRLHWERDRLSLPPALRELPRLYLEHDPPQQHPSNTVHWAQQADLIVHVTPFNRLMWDCGEAPARTIEHSAVLPEGLAWRGSRPEGLAVVNNLMRRGRRLGCDLYLDAQRRAPLRLVGMASDGVPGGLGEVVNHRLPAFMADFRYLFHCARWTSLSLAVVEAMSLGMPVLGLASTEITTVVERGVNGWIGTDPDEIVAVMQQLSRDPALARRWGEAARATARQRFSPRRFAAEWLETIERVCARDDLRTAGAAPAVPLAG